MRHKVKLGITTDSPESCATDCVIVGVHEEGMLSATAASVDCACGGLLSRIVARGDINGKPGSTLMVPEAAGVRAGRVLLAGIGRDKDASNATYVRVVAAALRVLKKTGTKSAALYLAEASPSGREVAWSLQQSAVVSAEVFYSFGKFKTQKDAEEFSLERLDFAVEKKHVAAARAALSEGEAIGEGVALAKDLGNLPPNVCTPAYLSERAVDLAERFKLNIDVLDREEMEKLGMQSLLSVSRGSSQPPKFVVLSYRGASKLAKPIVLIGKGVTFDSGGISLKHPADMAEMKFDMCGAASVLGALSASARMKLPLNIVAVIPAIENMPDGNAARPGDIITSMSGQTVEIVNTDAEGRLILCDALTYIERFDPACVVDVATLTGACVVALGNVASGLFGNDEQLVDELLLAGEKAGDRAWALPLLDDYQEQLDSTLADMTNAGERAGGAITAACFLSRFAKKYAWAHLDIAGTACRPGKEKVSTGRPVPLLCYFLMARAKHQGSRPSQKYHA